MQGARDARLPGVVLGVGLGGFLDGIVLHQLLQWHHLVSSKRSTTTVAGLEANTLWDGVFHAAMWVAVAVGVALVYRVRHQVAGRTVIGWALIGWGGFNVFDSVVDHWLLELHHIREGVDNEWAYDAGFFVFGLVQIAAGWLLRRIPAGPAGPGSSNP